MEYHIRIRNPKNGENFKEKVINFFKTFDLQKCLVGYEISKSGIQHIHAYVKTDKDTQETYGKSISKIFGSGNKTYSISKKRKNTLTLYVCKDKNIIYHHGYSDDDIEDLLRSAKNTKSINISDEIYSHLDAKLKMGKSVEMSSAYETTIEEVLNWYKEKGKLFPDKNYMMKIVNTWLFNRGFEHTVKSYYTKYLV